MDREKVIKALEYCRNQAGCWSDESECPWIAECREDVNSLKDATLALLKEQEPVKPKKDYYLNELSMAVDIYLCGKCGERLTGKGLYCSYCGTKTKL